MAADLFQAQRLPAFGSKIIFVFSDAGPACGHRAEGEAAGGFFVEVIGLSADFFPACGNISVGGHIKFAAALHDPAVMGHGTLVMSAAGGLIEIEAGFKSCGHGTVGIKIIFKSVNGLPACGHDAFVMAVLRTFVEIIIIALYGHKAGLLYAVLIKIVSVTVDLDQAGYFAGGGFVKIGLPAGADPSAVEFNSDGGQCLTGDRIYSGKPAVFGCRKFDCSGLFIISDIGALIDDPFQRLGLSGHEKDSGRSAGGTCDPCDLCAGLPTEIAGYGQG